MFDPMMNKPLLPLPLRVKWSQADDVLFLFFAVLEP